MVNDPFSDEFGDIGKRNEDHFDILGLIERRILHFFDIQSQIGITAVIKEGRVWVDFSDLYPLLG